MTIHGPWHDSILPQTGLIAKKVPRRAIVFKALHGKKKRQKAKGKKQKADGRWFTVAACCSFATRHSCGMRNKHELN
jgi:hypothetical protein